ncbi:hypothetical protein BLA29_012890 [Euroglyphus maynei]|uniref:Uncharacterized protein n=1 Tax=Euroglyphus maynei TaxID=6958 RepID=A0A1Y3BRW4_EURMA|nr:hypothetical protein BLA29_012890 [Euroglyphus maynei]
MHEFIPGNTRFRRSGLPRSSSLLLLLLSPSSSEFNKSFRLDEEILANLAQKSACSSDEEIDLRQY